MESGYVLMPVVLIIFCVCFFGKKRRYKATSYYRLTKNPYRFTMKDKGRFGEYQIYRRLAFYERKGAKFLFNCYLPKGTDETTEVDAVMLHSSGLYVFESKNYGGWIYGQEEERMWTQLLRDNRGFVQKERFYNPLIQNRSHVRLLKKFLGIGTDIPVYSVVVFSDRCVLKKVSVSGLCGYVTTWKELRRTVRKLSGKSPKALEEEEILTWRDQLYPYTQISRKKKREHIRNIRRRQEKKGFFHIF